MRVYASSALTGALTGFLANYRADLVSAIPKYADKPEMVEQFKGDLALIDAGPKLAPDEVIDRLGSADHRRLYRWCSTWNPMR